MEIDSIVKDIKDGLIIIMPTDTTYGIVCDATNLEAVKRVYEIKKRDFSKPLIILVSDYNMLNDYAFINTDLEKEIIHKYWPGPLSILFKKKDSISDLVTANSPMVAVRIPLDNGLRDIIKKVNKPIIASSANISGSDVITNIKEIEKDLLASIDKVYDGGKINCLPSTLIKITNNNIVILRDGLLSEKIKKDYKLN